MGKDELAAEADAIRALLRAEHDSKIEVGRRLIDIKKTLGHGNFLDWVQHEFAMTPRTAQRYMAAARGKNVSMSYSRRPLRPGELPPLPKRYVEDLMKLDLDDRTDAAMELLEAVQVTLEMLQEECRPQLVGIADTAE